MWIGYLIEFLLRIAEKMSGQEIGGTQRHFLTVAIFRSWRGLGGSAAPGLPGREKAYTRKEEMSTDMI